MHCWDDIGSNEVVVVEKNVVDKKKETKDNDQRHLYMWVFLDALASLESMLESGSVGE